MTLMQVVTNSMRLKHESELNDGTLNCLLEARKTKRSGSRFRNNHDEKPYHNDACHRHRSGRNDNRWD